MGSRVGYAPTLMIFLKKCYVNTTAGVDCIPITHEVQYALRDAGCAGGLITVMVPEADAGLIVLEPLPAVRKALQDLWTTWAGSAEATTNDSKKRTVAVGPRLLAAMLRPILHIPFHEKTLCLAPYTELCLVDWETTARRRECLVHLFGESAAPEGGKRAGTGGPPRA